MAKGLTTNRLLLGVLIVLSGAAALKAFVFKRTGDTGESVQASESLFSDLKKDEVSAFLIEAPEGKRHELAKDGDHWNVVSEGGARADTADVNKVLDAITRLKRGRVQTTRLENLSTYGLDDAKATKVTVWGKEGHSGKPAASFALGKIEGEWRFAFLKLPTEEAIRKVEGSVADYDAGSDNTWRDKTIYDLGPADKVAEVEILGPKGAIVLAREKVMGPKEKTDDASGEKPAETETPETEVKETVWNVVAPTPGRAKTWLCNSIAGYVAKLECDSFFAGTESLADLGLDPPQYTIKSKPEGAADSKAVLLVGSKTKDGKFAVKLPDGAQVWWIAGWKGEYLTKSVDDLLETPPPKPEAKPEEKPEEIPAEGTEAKPADAPVEPATREPEAKPADSTEPATPPNDDGKPPAPAPAPAPTEPAKPPDGGR